jgi:hypothetical protein
MNFRELEEMLPNGFHDTYLLSAQMNFQDRIVIFHVNVCMETEAKPKALPLYEEKLLRFEGVSIANFEPSFSFFNSKYTHGLQLDSIDVRDSDIQKFVSEGHKPVIDGFWCGFFIFESSAIIILNAQRVFIENAS